MKCSAILSLLISVTWANALTPPVPDNDLVTEEKGLKLAREKCQSVGLTRIDAEHEKMLFHHQQLEAHQIEYHVLCMVIEMDLMKTSGEILVDNLKTHLSHIIKDEKILEEHLDRCKQVGPEALKTAMHLFFCMHDAMMRHHDLYANDALPLFGAKSLSYDSPLNTAAIEPNPNAKTTENEVKT